MALEELLPPGVYPIWSSYDSFEAADTLRKTLAEDEADQKVTSYFVRRTISRRLRRRVLWCPVEVIPMPVTIREVAEDELPALLHLYTHLNPNDPALPLDGAAQIWASMVQNPNQYLFGAYLSGSLAATCTLVIIANLTRGGRPYALIENVVTHADYRRRGYATALLKHALTAAWAQHCYKVMLLTGSRNEETLRFYEQAGFERGIKTSFVARPGE